MTKPATLQRFESIAEILASADSGREPLSDEFDAFSFHELPGKTKKMMPPHRRAFYTVLFFKDQKSGQININQNQHSALQQVILFQGMDHIFSFVRDEQVEGTVLMFKKSFLLPFVDNLEESFPYFHVLNHNLFHLNAVEQEAFERLLHLIKTDGNQANVVKPLLVALLEKANLLYATYASEEQFLSKKMQTVRKYKSLIGNSFLEHREVSYYADQLHVTSNYLNEVVKSETGISAKRHISERVLLEAKNLLSYSTLDISEISHMLQFSEPTHFTKFFKKETGKTPKAFQKEKP